MRSLEYKRLIVEPSPAVPGRPRTFNIYTASLNRWSYHTRLARVFYDPGLGNFLVDLRVGVFMRFSLSPIHRFKLFYPSRHRHPLTLLQKALRFFLDYLS